MLFFVLDDGKEKKVVYDFEPFKKVNTTLYYCDNKFHVEPLMGMLESNEKFGFIIMDGNGCLYGTLTGSTKEILYRFSVELPKKHGRGGQSSLRFARIRIERRHNYLRKCAEIATQMFITNDHPNVSGLIVAGSADFKTDLAQSDIFDLRLHQIVLKIVDIAYGGEAGFIQAIELSKECLQDVKFLKEKKLIDQFMYEIAMDSGKFVYGVDDTMKMLEAGVVQVLIVWEGLPHIRYTITNPTTQQQTIAILTPDQAKDSKKFVDEQGQKLEVEGVLLLEWLANNKDSLSCKMEFVSNRTQEGAQFCKGFGGMGGILRYKMATEAEFKVVDDEVEDGEKAKNLEDDLSEFI